VPKDEPCPPSFEELALAFRAYVEHAVETPVDVATSLAYFELPEGLAERVVGLLERTEAPPGIGEL
jgi:hypothetical protein